MNDKVTWQHVKIFKKEYLLLFVSDAYSICSITNLNLGKKLLKIISGKNHISQGNSAQIGKTLTADFFTSLISFD